jgi:hypothetical protein
MTLAHSFNPVKEAYWTGYPHHRRTPFAVSPDGKSAYLAYLDESGTDVHIQGLNPSTFAAVGDPVTVKGGKEAGGLTAHNDGFALLTNEPIAGEADGQPIAVLYRYVDGKQTWKTFLGGPGIDSDSSLASPDINGDLVFSEKAGYYAAYIVVTAYKGAASGHFGDAIRYITPDGKLENISGASSSWGCSHNTGIAFEAADAPPFASVCAEDQGAIWYNSMTRGMSNDGVKVSNEKVINGASNEPLGGMSGSYSSLARFIGEDSYVLAWVSRGAVDLTANDWMGQGYTKAENRTNNRNVAIAMFSDKATLVGKQASSEVGAADGDSQINWVTDGSNDCSNAHAAAFDGSKALITWEEISNPQCPFEAMGCAGAFAGTKFQMVGSDGKKIGEPIVSTDTYVAGDMVTMSDGRICWPYVNMDWKLDGPSNAAAVTKMSFACISSGTGNSGSAPVPASTSQPAPTASAQSTEASGTETKAAETGAEVATSSAPASSVSSVASSGSSTEDAVKPTAISTKSSAYSSVASRTASQAISVVTEPVRPTKPSISDSQSRDTSTKSRKPRPTKQPQHPGSPGRPGPPNRPHESECPRKTCKTVTEWETVYVTATAA